MAKSQTNFAWATLLDVAGGDVTGGDVRGSDVKASDDRASDVRGSDVRGRDVRSGDRGPAHERLAAALRTAIRDGRLVEGDAVPPSRALAEELGCSRWVVTEAYGQLVAEGYLAARVGSATRVAWTPGAGHPRRLGPAVRDRPPVRYDLAPGLPDLRAFPRRRWTRAVSDAIAAAVHDDLGPPDPAGHPALRRTLAGYLRRSRGADVRSATVTVCAGITDGLARVCRALRSAGITQLAVEDPGWTRLHHAAASAGMRVHPMPVDDDGLCVRDLPAHGGVRAVVVGAAHQFPTGTVLSPPRRTELVRWARAVDGFVVEDDYDAEFRYDRRPVAVMQGMDPGRVFLLGSVSKTLSPALGLGWLVAPGALADTVRSANPVAPVPPVLDQLTLASFIDRGWYDAHLRAARRRFRARRDLLVETLTDQLPQGRIAGTAAGLHLLLHLPDGTDTAAAVAAAAASGLRLMDLSAYRSGGSGTPALVIGYGNISAPEIPPAVALLRQAVASASA